MRAALSRRHHPRTLHRTPTLVQFLAAMPQLHTHIHIAVFTMMARYPHPLGGETPRCMETRSASGTAMLSSRGRQLQAGSPRQSGFSGGCRPSRSIRRGATRRKSSASTIKASSTTLALANRSNDATLARSAASRLATRTPSSSVSRRSTRQRICQARDPRFRIPYKVPNLYARPGHESGGVTKGMQRPGEGDPHFKDERIIRTQSGRDHLRDRGRANAKTTCRFDRHCRLCAGWSRTPGRRRIPAVGVRGDDAPASAGSRTRGTSPRACRGRRSSRRCSRT